VALNILFSETDPAKALAAIKKALNARDLRKMVSIDFEGDDLVVVISKLGKSKLRFSFQEGGTGLQYTLTSEKIAFAHRIFKDDVTDEVRIILQEAGGVVED
jgi:hypothetical protein